MAVYYSVIAPGFYPDFLIYDYIAAGTWPSDAILLSESEEITLRAARERGDAISYENAQWVIYPLIPDHTADYAAAAQIKRDKLANAATQIDILFDVENPEVVATPTTADVTLLLAWRLYRQELRSVATNVYPVTWPDVPVNASGY